MKATPYTIVVDTREQRRFEFAHPIRIGAKEFSIRAVRGTLRTGDYSILGFEDQVACERKSLVDTFGRGRDRFERELARLAQYKFAAVVVEAEWSTILTAPPPRTKLRPRSVLGSVIAWQCRWPTIQWCFLPGREVAEAYTARMLDRFWRDQANSASPQIEICEMKQVGVGAQRS